MLIFFQDPLCGKRILRELESQVFCNFKTPRHCRNEKPRELKPSKLKHSFFVCFCAKDTIARSAAAWESPEGADFQQVKNMIKAMEWRGIWWNLWIFFAWTCHFLDHSSLQLLDLPPVPNPDFDDVYIVMSDSEPDCGLEWLTCQLKIIIDTESKVTGKSCSVGNRISPRS